MYLSSGAVMDGLVFGPWQAGGRMGERGPYREGFAWQLRVGQQRGSVFGAIIQRERGEKMVSLPAFLFFHCGSLPKGKWFCCTRCKSSVSE